MCILYYIFYKYCIYKCLPYAENNNKKKIQSKNVLKDYQDVLDNSQSPIELTRN